MRIFVQDFTGIYSEQPFMQELKKQAETAQNPMINDSISWMDCTQIQGTDCYCDDDAVKALQKPMDAASDLHFFDNGNYHYMSKLWTDLVQEPFSLIVFDHHPDMQPPRFGNILSCGGWILEVLEKNQFIQNVLVIGVDDKLIDTHTEAGKEIHEICSRFPGRISFISEREIANGQSPDVLYLKINEFIQKSSSKSVQDETVKNKNSNLPKPAVYLSIDKDALSTAYAATNWDQGSLTLCQLEQIIAHVAKNSHILGVDICGEWAKNDSPSSFQGRESAAEQPIKDLNEINNNLNQELVEFLRNLFREGY